MNGRRVSVVIPSYQQEQYIDDTVRSVLEQDDVDLELIVSDHSSADGTWERVQSHANDPRMRIMRIPSGGGAAANWAAVTDAASGDYIKLLPGDDTLLPGTLRRQSALLDAHPEAALVAGRRNIVDASGRLLGRGRGLRGIGATLTGSEAIRAAVRSGTNPFGEPGAVMMRRSALMTTGGWHHDWSYAIDVATYFRVLGEGGFIRDDEIASTFRVSSSQWSVALAASQAEEMSRLFRQAAADDPAITDADVRLGARRARLMAQQRRLVYLLLKGRMG